MRIRVSRSYASPNGETLELTDYIKRKLSDTWQDGSLEQARQTADNAIEACSKIMSMLLDKGILTLDEIKEMVPMCGDIQEEK